MSQQDPKVRKEDILIQQIKREKQADYFLEFFNMMEKEKGATN